MTQGQLTQMFQRANARRGDTICQHFGDVLISVRVSLEGFAVQCRRAGAPITWDRLQSMCDDY
ncbi:hypothetical protein PQ43W_61 [Ralstonia phage PQ43W]